MRRCLGARGLSPWPRAASWPRPPGGQAGGRRSRSAGCSGFGPPRGAGRRERGRRVTRGRARGAAAGSRQANARPLPAAAELLALVGRCPPLHLDSPHLGSAPPRERGRLGCRYVPTFSVDFAPKSKCLPPHFAVSRPLRSEVARSPCPPCSRTHRVTDGGGVQSCRVPRTPRSFGRCLAPGRLGWDGGERLRRPVSCLPLSDTVPLLSS